MKKILYIIFTFLFLSTRGQEIKGFYTGELRLMDINERLNVQMDIMEDSTGITGVFRTRIIDNQQVVGCDNWLTGNRSGTKMFFTSQVPLRITNIPDWLCTDYKTMTFEQRKARDGSGMEWLGVLYREEGGAFGRVVMRKVDSVNSYTVDEEREEAKYLMNEKKIFLAVTDSARINLMLAGRGTQIIDSLVIDTSASVLKLEAPGADILHKLTVLVNDNVVLLNNSPAQRGTNIRLNNLEEGDVDILFLCYHFMVNANFNVKLTLEYNGGIKVWEIPVTTYKNRGIRLKVQNSVSPSSNVPSD